VRYAGLIVAVCAALLGLAALMTRGTPVSRAEPGRYQFLATDNARAVWRGDTHTGGVSLCVGQNVNTTPVCTQWSGAPGG
jgi:hypothetical protein